MKTSTDEDLEEELMKTSTDEDLPWWRPLLMKNSCDEDL